MSFCSELSAKLDTIIAQMGDLAACCASGEVIYGNPPDYSLSGTGLVPQAVVDAGYATDTSDWDGYHDYKCMASHILVDNLEAVVDSFGSLVETAGITLVKVAGVLASAWFAWVTGGASIVILGKFVVSDFIIWQALEALGSWAAADLHDLVSDIEAIRDDIACAAVNADGLYEIKSAVDAVLTANLSASAATLVKLANTQAKINAFFAPVYGEVDVAAWLADYGADTADYDCTCQGTAIGKVITHWGCTSHAPGDIVYEGQAIRFDAYYDAPNNRYLAHLLLSNPAGNGPVGTKYWYCTEEDGWTDIENEFFYWNPNSSPPYYGSAHIGSLNWNATKPLRIWRSGFSTDPGYQACSTTDMTMTWRIYLTQQ